MQISRLHIIYQNRSLVDIGFHIDSSLALVGQSGSGKSLTIKALLNILPHDMKLTLQIQSDFDLIAGKSVGFVPQNPFTALSPLTKIKDQFFVSHERVLELLEQVGLEETLLHRYPPELSGGQLQRMIIAMALSMQPRLLLLDEPTTALDPTTRANIIRLLEKLQKTMQFTMLFVTHDINSAKLLCKDICVIKDGRVVESGKTVQIMQYPQNIYTKTLIEANFTNRNFRE